MRFEELDTVDAALERVERLRNAGEVSDVRVYRELPITVRTYYRVTVSDDAAPAVAPVAASDNGGAPAAEAGVTGDDAPPGAMPLRPAPAAVAEVGDEPAEDLKRSRFGRA